MISAQQIRMARAALKWTVADLAERTGLHRHTLASVERDDPTVRESTYTLLKTVLEAEGIEFVSNGVVVNK